MLITLWVSAQTGTTAQNKLELQQLENEFYAKNRLGTGDLKNELQQALEVHKKNKNEKACAQHLYLIGKIHYTNKRLDSAETAQKRALKLSQGMDNIPMQMATHRALGAVYYYNQENDKALNHLNNSLELATTIDDTINMAKALNNIGLVYKTMENYSEAISFLERALNYKIAMGAKREQISTLTNMGYCYSMLNLFEKSDYFYNKALMLASEQQHNPQISRIWLHMAQNYAWENKIDLAESFFKKSILMSEQIQDSVQLLYTRKYFAEFYFENNQIEKALHIYQSILPHVSHISDGFFLSEYYLGVGDCYTELHDMATANMYYREMLTVNPPYNKLAMQRGMRILSEISKENGDYKQALAFIEKSNEITLELQRLEKDRSIEKYKIAYNSAQNEADIEQLIEINEDLEESKEKNQILLFTVLTLLFIALIVAIALGIVAKKSRANEDKLQIEIVKNQRKNLELQQANNRVKKWSKIKGEFITMISHEVRTPLNAIIGMSQLLHDTHLTQEQKNKLNNIDFSSHNLLTLMNDILDFSSLQENKLSIHLQPSNLTQILHSVVAIYAPQFEENHVRFNTHFADDLPQSIYTDEHRLKQVLSNLLSNALKFTHFGQVEFNVSLEKFHQLDGSSYADLKFAISDTGIGVPKDKQDVLFKSFTQTDSTVTRKYRGVGLGLSICGGILKEFNSKISFTSEFGKGSTFWFPLSVKVNTPVSAPENQTAEKSQASIAHAHPMKILVAEDNAINRSLMELSLQKMGYNPELVENGQEAVEACKHAHFDLILMDIQMPILDGISATQAIRLLNKAQQPIIIAVTANAIGHEKEQYIKSGMDDYLAKPYTIHQLTAMLQKHAPKVAVS